MSSIIVPLRSNINALGAVMRLFSRRYIWPATLPYIAIMKTTTWGIIGPGKIAGKFATALGMVEGARLGAIASRDAARGQEFASRFGVATVYDDYTLLAADPTIDAIYVATPHGFHAEHSILCLRHGKAVLCEKPLALNARECGG